MTRAISISELRTFRRCRRKWWLGYFRQLRFKRPRVTGVMEIGNRIHAALEAYYDRPDADLDVDVAFNELTRLYDRDVERVNAYGVEQQVDVADLLKDLYKDHELCWIMLQGYFDWLEETAHDANLRVLGVERAVLVPSPVDGFMLQGKLDQLVELMDVNFIGFLDHKSVGSLSDLPKTAHQNEQGLMYCVLLRLMYPDVHVDGEIFNLMRRVKRTSTAKPPFYARHRERWNNEELNSFYARLQGMITDLARVEADLRAGVSHLVAAYPTPTGDCSWDCEFLPVCTMFDDGSRVEDAVQVLYEQHDPYERYSATAVKEEAE